MSRAEALFGGLVEGLPAALLVFEGQPEHGAGLRLVYANAAARASMTSDREAGLGLEEVLPDLLPEGLEALTSVLRSGQPRTVPGSRLLGARGDEFEFHLLRPAASHIALLRRPTQATAQRELDKVGAFLESIVENIPAMIFVKDAETLAFELFNRAGEELLGMSRNDLIGKSDEDFFPPEQASFFTEQDRNVLRKKELVDIPLEPIDTAHGRRWLHTKKIPILDAAGEAKYLLGISLDITDRHRAEQGLLQARNELEHRVLERTAELSRTVEQLKEAALERRRAEEALKKSEERLRLAQKMEGIGRLAGGIAHDFNNMLSVILGQVDIALGRLEASGRLRESLEAIRLAASRSTALTQQLLAFSRQQVVSPRLIDVNELLRNLEKMLNRVIGDDVVLVTAFETNLGLVRVDPGQIEQAVVNLVINARDAMPSGGTLTLATSEVEIDHEHVRMHPDATLGRHVLLRVIDTGTGIDKETQKRMFEPFFTTKEPGRGTGLGLATVYGIVHQSGGSVAVDSELGQGSEFRLYLPLAKDVSEPRVPTPREVPRTTTGDETILVVEDEELVRKVARASLETYGYRVILAADGYEALEIGKRGEAVIDAVVTDIIMPGLTGLTLAQELRQLRPELRVLYMSGYTDKTLIDTTALGPRESFIGKPFTPSGLTAKLRELLDRKIAGP